MPLVRILRGWTARSLARFSAGDVAGFEDDEAQLIVGAGAGVYADLAAAAMAAPPQDKMMRGPVRSKGGQYESAGRRS